MKDKSGYSRMIALIRRQSESVNPEGLFMATVTASGISFGGIEITSDDYDILSDFTATATRSTQIGKLKTGDTVLVYQIADEEDERYLILGKVI